MQKSKSPPIPKPFWFDGALLYGWVETEDDLRALERLHPKHQWKLAKRDVSDDVRPNFGFRDAHRGEQTLGEWLEPAAAPVPAVEAVVEPEPETEPGSRDWFELGLDVGPEPVQLDDTADAAETE